MFGGSVPLLDLSLQDSNEIVQICDKVLECFLERNLSVFNT